MVTCNICRKNKILEELNPTFNYVCMDCWEDMEIKINGYEINKDLIY